MKFGDVTIEGICVKFKIFLVRLNDPLLQLVSDHFSVVSNFHNSLFHHHFKDHAYIQRLGLAIV